MVVRGREQLGGLVLEVRRGGGSCARCAWPSRAGARRQLAALRGRALPDGARRRLSPARDRARRAGQHARDRPRQGDRARGRALAAGPRDRRGRRVRVGISADARSLRLDLARLGGPPSVLARGTHAPAAVARVPPATPGGVYVVSNRHAGRLATALSRCAARGLRAWRCSCGTARGDAAAYQRRLDALGIRFDALTRRDLAQAPGRLRGARRSAGRGERRRDRRRELVRTLAGIRPGLGA